VVREDPAGGGRGAGGRRPNPEGTFYLTGDDGRTVEWGSPAAVRADMGAIEALREPSPEWASLPLAVRYQTLQGLRLFLETCPSCSGAVSTATRRVDSCCAELTVDVLECEGCGETFLELDRQSTGDRVTDL